MTRPTISAFFPCFNDQETIGDLVLRTEKILQKFSSSFEIIVINDGSFDNSQRVLEDLLPKIKNLKIISHKTNLGYGAALRSGFNSAKKELIFYTDGDGQYSPEELPILLSCMTSDVSAVNGIKIQRQDQPLRIFLGHVYKSIMRNLFDLPVYDPDCDFRLIRRSAMDKIKLKFNSGAVCIELVKRLQISGSKFREVSVNHYARLHGDSQFFKIKPIFFTSMDIIKLWIDLNLH